MEFRCGKKKGVSNLPILFWGGSNLMQMFMGCLWENLRKLHRVVHCLGRVSYHNDPCCCKPGPEFLTRQQNKTRKDFWWRKKNISSNGIFHVSCFFFPRSMIRVWIFLLNQVWGKSKAIFWKIPERDDFPLILDAEFSADKEAWAGC